MNFKEWLVKEMMEPYLGNNKDPATTAQQTFRDEGEEEKNNELPMNMRTHKATQAFAQMTPAAAKCKKSKK